jgi:hypothetical protein
VPEPTPRPQAPAESGSAAIAELVLGGASGPWRELGFAVERGRMRVGGVTVRLDPAAGGGLVAWTLRGLRGADLDGLPTSLDDGAAPEPAPASAHPNRAIAVDHVVVATPDLERTAAALAAAGLEQRRRRRAGSSERPVVQAFYRLGEVVLEVVGSSEAPPGPARFWGMVFTVADLDACAAGLGERLGTVRDAVQPGRRIATVRPEAGLGLPVALMSPPPAASARPGPARSGG